MDGGCYATRTSIVSGPAGTISTTTADFTWTGSDNLTSVGNLTYAYRLDPLEQNFSAFGSGSSKSYTNLASGNYTFYVKAQDQAANQDSTPAARSFTVNVGGPLLTVSPTTATPGAAVTISWSGIGNPTPTDWIALYAVGQPNSNYLAWLYVNCAKLPSNARASGSCQFTLPASLAIGNYDFRLLANDGFNTIATTPLTVQTQSLPVVTVVGSDGTATENNPSDTGVFTVSRTGSTTSALTVSYTIGGTATNGVDYQNLSGTVVIAVGQSSAAIIVTPIDDTTVEGNETVVVTLANGAYTIGVPSSATVTIVDDEPPLSVVTIVASDANAAEAGLDPAVFTVSRTGSTARH